MNDQRLFIDFGSTYTKVVYIDLCRNEIISRAQHPSTIERDITQGLKECFKKIDEDLGNNQLVSTEALACSSAAGGLRIACIGFVPDYSSEAANRAALGAGAKVVGCYSYEMTRKEIEEINDLCPDIILLTGGTEGGDKRVIIHNAKMLATRKWPNTIIMVAGNRTAYDEIEAVFKVYGQKVLFTNNVMPELGRLDVDSCNNKIREIFINTIVDAKGIGKAKALIKNVLMPTPSAVLDAVRLLAEGYGDTDGLGELLVIDVGGATTDVHSVSHGKPSRGAVVRLGLPEPYVKRTVEGDLGMRLNVDKLIALAKERGETSTLDPIAQKFYNPGFLPIHETEMDCHILLCRLAVEVAVNRHVGRIEERYGPMGEMLVQHGKDFSQVGCVIGTGGPIVFSRDPGGILSGALFQEDSPHILKPKAPKLYLDADYILYAGGLLSRVEPEKALRFMKKHLKEVG